MEMAGWGQCASTALRRQKEGSRLTVVTRAVAGQKAGLEPEQFFDDNNSRVEWIGMQPALTAPSSPVPPPAAAAVQEGIPTQWIDHAIDSDHKQKMMTDVSRVGIPRVSLERAGNTEIGRTESDFVHKRRFRDADSSNTSFARAVVTKRKSLYPLSTINNAPTMSQPVFARNQRPPLDNDDVNHTVMSYRFLPGSSSSPPPSQRNDLMGGSGVGLGGVQFTTAVRPHDNEENFSSLADTKRSALPSHGHGNQTTAVKNNKKKKNKGTTYKKSKGGRGGSWKNKKQRGRSNRSGRGNSRDVGNAPARPSSTRRQYRNATLSSTSGSGWVASDDPNLRHVGGAEIMF